MSVLRGALGNEAAPHTLEHKGRTYTLSLIDQVLKTAWSERLFERACKAAKAMRPLMSQDEYERMLTRLNTDYLEGEYDFEGEMTERVLTTKWGSVQLISLVFGVDASEAVKLLVERTPDVLQLLSLVQAESLPDVPKSEGNGDPNAPRQGGQPLPSEKPSWQPSYIASAFDRGT